MARDFTPKYKRSRREGVELHPDLDKAGTAKSPLTKRSYFPGVHGPRVRFARYSNYGRQLREKQKAKRMYGILERQFRNYYRKAIQKQGDTGEVMLSMLETRLDNVVYMLGLAKTRPAARQMVNHGNILVNGKKVDIPSFEVRVGDEISVREKIAGDAKYKERIKSFDRSTPSWLAKKQTSGKMVSSPDLSEPKLLIDMRPIVEFYSR